MLAASWSGLPAASACRVEACRPGETGAWLLGARFTGDARARLSERWGWGACRSLLMSSAYRLHPESHYSSPPRLHHKLGLAFAFIIFGSIAGAGSIVLHLAGDTSDGNGGAVIAGALLKPGPAHATSPAAAPPPVVSASQAPPADPVQTAPAAAMIAAAPEPVALAAPEPAPLAAPEPAASANAEPAMPAATEPVPPPVAAATKPKKKAARSQGRRDRGWYDAYAWSPRADYGRYGRSHWRPIW